LVAYYFLFLTSAVARRLRHAPSLVAEEIQQVGLNNSALYLAAILLFGNGNFEVNLAVTTGSVALFTGLLGFAAVFSFPSEIILQRMLAWQSIVLLVMFIGFRWEGLTVTLLWLSVAVFLFAWGAWDKKSWP